MKKFRDFESAREFVRNLGLKNNTKWREYCKSGNKPDDISANPQRTYKKEWKGSGDWLGNGNTRDYKSFTEAREFVRSLELSGERKWREYSKSDNKPDDIPSAPNTVYKNEFKGYGDWLGNEFRPYKEAREFVRSLGLKSIAEWNKYCKSGNKPDDIRSRPDNIYKKTKEWKDWGDWLGTGRIANYNKKYRPYKEAREFVRALNLKGIKEWKEYCKSGNKPDDIPADPWKVYKEWKK